MDIREYVAWCEKNEMLATMSDRAKTPCDDCLASHALEMRDTHKCYAWDGERKRVFLDELNPDVGNYETEPVLECGLSCGVQGSLFGDESGVK